MQVGWYVLVGFLAAFGVLSLLWCVSGWLFTAGPQGWVLCAASAACPGFVPLFLWLRSLGLVRCPLIVVDFGLSEGQRRQYLAKGLRIYPPDQVPAQQDFV